MARVVSICRTGLLSTTGLAAACLVLHPCAALAQGASQPAVSQPTASEATPQKESEIVVTGSRIKRDGFDASTPVAVVNEEDIKLSGTVNVERMLAEQPQFVASTNGGATSNTVPGGTADVNLRGFGATRNLVLVNGRRFAIAGPDQTTDLNTIPTALIERTEIVTGGSSAVYGSDAITGVVNFIMRDDFEGVEARAQMGVDSSTKTFNRSFTVTAGGNFSEDRGNVVVSLDYATRGGITRGERGGFTGQTLNDGCITSDTATPFGGGTRLTVPAGQTCRQAGGIPGFFFAPGSGDIPFSRLSGIPLPGSAQSNPALNAAYAAAGLSNMSSFGITFDPTGLNQRAALDPADRYDLAPENYLVIPQERWMINTFAHYDIADGVTGYLEGHYSSNEVKMQLAPSNVGVPTLLNVNNPYLSPAMRAVLNQLDLRETGTTTVVSGPASRTTTPGDGLAVVTVGKRYVEAGDRQADEKRNVFRVTGGLRGDIGSKDEGFLSDLSYDAYYTYARTETTELLFNALSRSRLQASQLSAGAAAPVCDVFGSNVSEACASAIRISATNTTEATLQVASASITGNLFDLGAGPAGFSFGVEWRKTEAQYRPDSFLSSGDVVGFNAGLPTGGSISAKEVFGEVRLPILRDQPFFEELTLNGAFRYSDYSLDGVGGVWTYLGGAEWQPVQDIRFRAQFQHAIRAPNVGDLYAGSTRSVPVATDPCSSRQPAAQQTAAVRAVCVATGVPAAAVFTAGVQPNNFFPVDAGGNPNLGPEESDTFTAGVVLTPTFVPNLRISADYFDIELDGAIAPLGGGLNNTLNLCYNILQDANSEFCQAVNRNPVTGEINDPYTVKILQANTGGLETSGIDFALQYEFEIGWLGRISVGSDWTWTDEFTSTPVLAFPNIQNKCVGSWGLTCGEPIPEWRGITRINLQSGIWGLGIRHRYIASVTNDRYILPYRSGGTPPALDTLSYPVLPARNYFDINFTVDVTDRFQFYGGARNIFNEKPPAVGSQSVRSNTWPATYDVLGTEMFLGLVAKF